MRGEPTFGETRKRSFFHSRRRQEELRDEDQRKREKEKKTANEMSVDNMTEEEITDAMLDPETKEKIKKENAEEAAKKAVNETIEQGMG